MRGFRRALGASVIAVAAVAACPLTAGATPGRRIRISDRQFSATGSLTFVWHGDRGRGCTSMGLCGIRGALVLYGASVDVFTINGQPKGGSVFGPGTARVRRDDGSSAPGECVDATEGSAQLNFERVAGKPVVLVQPSDVSSACAGPLASDLTDLTLPVSRVGKGNKGFDLRGSVPFVAGPFRGRLVSTLVLRPAPANGGGSSSSSSSSGGSRPGSGRPSKRRYAEIVGLTYDLTAGPPSLRFGFRGDPGPFCETLDDCGARGQLLLRLSTPSTMKLQAVRIVRSRQTSRQILNHFHADPGAFAIEGFAQLPASVAETMSWGGGLVCHDTVTSASPGPEQVGLFVGSPGLIGPPGKKPQTRGELQAALTSNGGEILRTHCPGPTSADALGQQGLVARATVDPRGLLGKQDVIDFARPGTFNALGYSGRRSGKLELRLSLLKVAAQTRLER